MLTQMIIWFESMIAPTFPSLETKSFVFRVRVPEAVFGEIEIF